jgi:hypothetical protein
VLYHAIQDIIFAPSARSFGTVKAGDKPVAQSIAKI